MMKKVGIIVLFLAICSQVVKAQDIAFSQFYANPLYLNPALAGTAVCPRISLGGRAQWMSIPNAYNTIFASYDQHVDALYGGIGLLIISDREGNNQYRRNSASLMYSYRLQINKSIHMNFALEASIKNDYLNWDGLVFPAQLLGGASGINRPSSSQIDQWYPDFAAGVVAYADRWYGGAAVSHLLQPNNGIYGESIIPMKITVHGGVKLNVKEDARRTSPLGIGTPIVSPNLIYQHQMGINYFSYGVYLDWVPFVTGVWFRHGVKTADAFIILLGYENEKFRIGYSYDLTVSQLSTASGGSHELTLGWNLPCPEKKKKIKKISCPTF